MQLRARLSWSREALLLRPVLVLCLPLAVLGRNFQVTRIASQVRSFAQVLRWERLGTVRLLHTGPARTSVGLQTGTNEETVLHCVLAEQILVG